LSEKDQLLFQKFVAKAREHAANGNVKSALELSKKAYGMCPTGKLKKKIDKMEASFNITWWSLGMVLVIGLCSKHHKFGNRH
jgi:hypothetical protein